MMIFPIFNCSHQILPNCRTLRLSLNNRNYMRGLHTLLPEQLRHYCTSESVQTFTAGSLQKSAFGFVPSHRTVTEFDVKLLETFVAKSKRLFVLTGAGISTESGIPDYRSEVVGLYAKSKNRPIQYQDFLKSASLRQRYWARNSVGWPRFSSFEPNDCHKTFSHWEYFKKIHWLVTQNVDALHYKAGSHKVTELHGSAHRVVCLDCKFQMKRTELQEMIQEQNPSWKHRSEDIAPDGDVQLSEEQIQGFKVPCCPNCGGMLKPEIVFFGDNVARDVVDFVYSRLHECDAMLIAGSSLQVFSGYRYANAAKDMKIPLAIINIGPTRADKIADFKFDVRCGDILPRIKLS
ncbi:hypothetical protein ACJMK2_011717 [Sinanodonta woodiana]|uniref:NAD-dependent protein deacylase n=1 Tax=Sinanodonta woodiana TaxID=1069815 RepID=A0ABD3V5Y0_SINWO